MINIKQFLSENGKINRKEVFKEAHKRAKSFEGDYSARLSLALKGVYKEIKLAAEEITKEAEKAAKEIKEKIASEEKLKILDTTVNIGAKTVVGKWEVKIIDCEQSNYVPVFRVCNKTYSWALDEKAPRDAENNAVEKGVEFLERVLNTLGYTHPMYVASTKKNTTNIISNTNSNTDTNTNANPIIVNNYNIRMTKVVMVGKWQVKVDVRRSLITFYVNGEKYFWGKNYRQPIYADSKEYCPEGIPFFLKAMKAAGIQHALDAEIRGDLAI